MRFLRTKINSASVSLVLAFFSVFRFVIRYFSDISLSHRPRPDPYLPQCIRDPGRMQIQLPKGPSTNLARLMRWLHPRRYLSPPSTATRIFSGSCSSTSAGNYSRILSGVNRQSKELRMCAGASPPTRLFTTLRAAAHAVVLLSSTTPSALRPGDGHAQTGFPGSR